MKLLCELTDAVILGREGLSNAKPRVTARAVMQRADGLYAVIYDAKHDFYSLPGGGVEEGEAVLTALRREILEETGCLCSTVEELGETRENRGHQGYTQVSYFYFVTTAGPAQSPQLTEYERDCRTQLRWHTLEEMLALICDAKITAPRFRFLQVRDTAVLREYVQRAERCL